MKPHQNIVYFIALIVVLTIGIQMYWNYIQYTNNRVQVIYDIQRILDTVSSQYARSHAQPPMPFGKSARGQTLSRENDSVKSIVSNVLQELERTGQMSVKDLKASAISYSVVVAAVNLAEFDKMLRRELKSRAYDLDYQLTITQRDKIKDSLGVLPERFHILRAQSQLTPVAAAGVISMYYADPVFPSLLKGLTGILLSFVLCGIIVFALYYLLRVINRQKAIAEIKNDFISNVTHEFKTPIATVSGAIEAIKNFNDDPLTEKTQRYLDISGQQLQKLNNLVEKVMETSVLESSDLRLNLQRADLVKLITEIVHRHQLNTNKIIDVQTDAHPVDHEIDAFHFENAVSNLIDNAVKYGGSQISVAVDKDPSGTIFIRVSDDGAGVAKQDAPFIFEKFYRAKNGNVHDVKGYGIGLYHTKKIIEKHNGTIYLKNPNTFLISLWTK